MEKENEIEELKEEIMQKESSTKLTLGKRDFVIYAAATVIFSLFILLIVLAV